MENESKHQEEEEEEEESLVHDRLTDDENFAELPAVEVMNKVSEEEAKSRAQSEYNKS